MIDIANSLETTMLPPFDAILFDFDGTLAVLNLDFALCGERW